RPEVLYCIGANGVAGVRGTPLHPLGSVDDHVYVLEDARIEALIFDPIFAERAAALKERVPTLRLLSLGPCEAADADLIEVAQRFQPQPLVPPAMDPDGLGGLVYTGGTTGKPKGVMSTFRSGATMTAIQMAEWEWPEDLRFLICTPLSHAGAAFFIPTLLRGGSLIVMPYFTPDGFLETVQEHKVTATMLVPTMLYTLLDNPRLDEFDLSSLDTVFYGAAAASPTRLKEAIERFGKIFFQFYGQAECPMTITVLRKDEHDPDDLERLATCGRPVPWVDVALLDDEGNRVPLGEPGEICVRGPLVMGGYWNKPEETAAAFEFDWLHTGDVAREDEQGFFTIVDRKKDMIVSGGFNVFPREIEDVLGTHPAVSQSAVIGVPDEKWGESVKAIVVLRPGQTAAPDELIALVKDAKGSHYAPKTVDFVEEIPLSPLGKPDKKALRAQYWGGAERQVN
ncbi:MAG: AMP-binding protein, partial [Actinomycetes bacterium]